MSIDRCFSWWWHSLWQKIRPMVASGFQCKLTILSNRWGSNWWPQFLERRCGWFLRNKIFSSYRHESWLLSISLVIGHSPFSCHAGWEGKGGRVSTGRANIATQGCLSHLFAVIHHDLISFEIWISCHHVCADISEQWTGSYLNRNL